TFWYQVTQYFALSRLHTSSSRIRGPDALGNLCAPLPLDHGNVMLALQVQPELGGVAKIEPETHSGVGRDCTSAIKDVSHAAGGHADVERQTVCAELARREFAFQQAAGMYDGSHGLHPLW